jgi:hypothetical protein
LTWLPLGIAVHASPAVIGDFGGAAWSIPKLYVNSTTRRFLKKALSLDEVYRGHFVAAAESGDQCPASAQPARPCAGDSPVPKVVRLYQ